jgi:hypothetical protein
MSIDFIVFHNILLTRIYFFAAFAALDYGVYAQYEKGDTNG